MHAAALPVAFLNSLQSFVAAAVSEAQRNSQLTWRSFLTSFVWLVVTFGLCSAALGAPLALKPISPIPANNATHQSPGPTVLSWANGGGAVSYDTYFGTSPILGATDFWAHTTSTFFTAPANEAGVTYYWRIDAFNSDGTVTTGNTWKFTTFTRIIELTGNLAFGPVAVGTTAQRTLVIKNTGDSVLKVNEIIYPDGFAGNWEGGPIAAGAHHDVLVEFSPLSPVEYGGILTVVSDKTDGNNTIGVSGVGVGVEVVQTPVILPNGGDYANSVQVTLICATEGSTIRFTINGSEPTATSSIYTSPFFMTNSGTVKAQAFKSGSIASAVASAVFAVTQDEVPTFTPVKASFTGLVNSDFASHGYGKVIVQTTATGKITGRMLVDGITFSFAGKLSTSGTYIKTLNGKGTLTLSLFDNGDLGGAWQKSGGIVYAIEGERDAVGTKSFPVVQKGRYTALLRGVDTFFGGENVRGYVLATVGANGTTSFVGSLPDGTKLSGSSRVSRAGRLPVAFGLYLAKRGYLFGQAEILGTGNGRVFGGDLRWTKPPQLKGIYSQGISDAAVELAGRIWTPPIRGERLVSDFDAVEGNLLVTLTGGNLGGPIVKAANLTRANVLLMKTRTEERLKMSVNPITGAFSGLFRHDDGRTRTIRGAFVRGQSGTVVEGFFPGVDKAGFVSVTVPLDE